MVHDLRELFYITHIKDLNVVLLSVTRDKLAKDMVTQTKVQPVATWKSNQPLQRAKAAATRKFDACSTKTANIIMANWSRMMWKSVIDRAIRMLASGPFGSHFFSARATVGGN
ncbi:hypothetical protein KIN20_015359 [Parelaphostrongylus tenuis]|uniref:Uncharacterized protein n=1 Tax=Parelaphostrongylus tenuis TaxID=148309 RepID=A0AAD5QM67_PARTN|nr:hypothetical protein KIN20_015359 [Parelaphostrongylus tenuis]